MLIELLIVKSIVRYNVVVRRLQGLQELLGASGCCPVTVDRSHRYAL